MFYNTIWCSSIAATMDKNAEWFEGDNLVSEQQENQNWLYKLGDIENFSIYNSQNVGLGKILNSIKSNITPIVAISKIMLDTKGS